MVQYSRYELAMADDKQIEILMDGVETWKKWRHANPEVRPNLTKADLRCAHLDRADLHRADLTEADLTHAFLHEANLCEAGDIVKSCVLEAGASLLK
jgi:uncharacterized protein YjbI with pentapeptide repeats